MEIRRVVNLLDAEFRRIGYTGEGPHEWKVWQRYGKIEIVWTWDKVPTSPNQRQLGRMLSSVASQPVQVSDPSLETITIMSIGEYDMARFFNHEGMA